MQGRLAAYQRRVGSAIETWLPDADDTPGRLRDAMRYCVLGDGKRIRPVLVYTTGEVLGVPLAQLDGPACAIELIHAYSLVHDDLPAMDDDDLRRGRPTCHHAFDEATAILVGDVLQVLAFKILASDPAMLPDAVRRLRMIELLADASGSRGMAGGQATDLAAAGRQLDLAALEHMHRLKTGALMHASVMLAALSALALDERRRDGLSRYASSIGLAFQIRDDILDVEGDEATLGKSTGVDRARDKPTFPSVAGMPAAKARALQLHREAVAALDAFDASADPLRWLSAFIVERSS
ncbi:MAG: polyprenyl synthetase family protein [Gammaproteobacteria bacterium]|nr:polyprenyl synthetase family protein [Gammaproteobacteria bacterium]